MASTRQHFQTLSLYYVHLGAPSRHVMLTARVLGIELNMIPVDLTKGEHLQKKFLKINPEHKVPSLDDNGFIISESRAIMTYLTERYGKKESLYPRNHQKRAKVNQFLYFDLGSLLDSLIAYYSPVFFGAKEFTDSKMPDIVKCFEYLNTCLEGTDFLVENSLTLADLALVSTVATAVIALDFSLKPYDNVGKWYNNLKKTLPEFKEIIEDNTQQLKQFIQMMKNNNNKK